MCIFYGTYCRFILMSWCRKDIMQEYKHTFIFCTKSSIFNEMIEVWCCTWDDIYAHDANDLLRLHKHFHTLLATMTRISNFLFINEKNIRAKLISTGPQSRKNDNFRPFLFNSLQLKIEQWSSWDNELKGERVPDTGMPHPGFEPGFWRSLSQYTMNCEPQKSQGGFHINGLVQERRNSSALAMELRFSCANPLIRTQQDPVSI